MKKLIALVSCAVFLFSTAEASVLGGTLKDSSSLPVGQGLWLHYNKFLSDQNGVGNQSEYYAEYTPNTSAVPVVMTGGSIYGKRNAQEAAEYMKNNEMVPMIGINASYFSFQTGIPMGHVITDGTVTSKDNRTLPGIGFKSDSTAFIEDMYIETNAEFGEAYQLQIPHINKLISPETQMLTLFTPDFGKETGVTTETLNVILENVSDKVRVGSDFTCTVGEIFTSDKPVELKQGQYVLSVNTKGNQWAITLINTMYKGEEIRVKTAAGNEIWNEAVNGLGSEGERLLINGAVADGLEKGASPRTAVGIKADGNIIFYVIDGRQPGYSYGARKDTVAKRLKELGCVNALNLDGGGSTTIAGVYPGCDNTVILNSPSEGVLRNVTNFIFIRNAAKPTGKSEMAYIYPYSGSILSGSTIPLDVKTVDENYYKTEHGNVLYSTNEYGSISENGELTALGEGNVTVKAETDGLTAAAAYKTVITPENIRLFNAENNAELTQIDVYSGDTVHLKAESYFDGTKLLSSNDAYRWSVNSAGVSIDESGVLVISDSFDGEAVLTVKAGGTDRSFKIIGTKKAYDPNDYPYSEIKVQDNKVIVDMYSHKGSISKTKSYVRIDGEKFDMSSAETVDSNHIRASFSQGDGFEGENYKILAVTVLDNGYSNVNKLSQISRPEENRFSDMSGHWAGRTVSYMNKMGVVKGYDENGESVFKPDGKVTRAEFAVMAVNTLGIDLFSYENADLSCFADMESIPAWAWKYVAAAYDLGIIAGRQETNGLYFAPGAEITRAEAAAIISRLLPDKLDTSAEEFADSAQIPSWAVRAFKTLNNAGIISGYDDLTVKPNNKVSRAEAVTMLYNAY